MKYTFILAELMMYPLSVVCPLLGVTQSGFHFWRRREPSIREQERERLSMDIQKEFDGNRGRYGAPRLYKAMCERHGYTGSFNRLQALMRAMGLAARAGPEIQSDDGFSASAPACAELAGTELQLRPEG